jgi:hypothetical protein
MPNSFVGTFRKSTTGKIENVTNRAWVGTNRARLGRIGQIQGRISGAKPAEGVTQSPFAAGGGTTEL